MSQGHPSVWRVETTPSASTPLVCLKLEISSKIVPRDTSIGTKILTLVPPEAKTVRDVKTHLAKVVLRTPVPFYFFVGEYRIRDDEDAIIFSLINEPCKLMPVPLPKPALASTPKGGRVSPANDGNNSSNNSSSQKRVTFFDGDSIESPVQRFQNPLNGMDALDHSHSPSRIAVMPGRDQFYIAAAQAPVLPSSSGKMMVEICDEKNETVDDPEKKKKRRRRTRRKSKKLCISSDEENSTSVNSNSNNTESSTNGRVINDEETESEDETSNTITAQDRDFEFVQPQPSTSCNRKRANSLSNSTTTDSVVADPVGMKKRPKVSTDSAFGSEASSDSFASPILHDASSSGKVRQDTPVPRVVKNPKTFEGARKLLQSQITVPEENSSTPTTTTSFIQRRSSRRGRPVETATSSQDHLGTPIKAEQIVPEEVLDPHIADLEPVKHPEDLVIGDVLTFRILELDERYNPVLSNFKEGIVMARQESQITFKYTKNDIIVRTGKYELPDMTQDNGCAETKSEEILQFAELVDCKFVRRSAATATVAELRGAEQCPPPPPII